MANEVTEYTINTNTFKSVYNLINDNKVSNTYVFSGFPNSDSQFPCYIINPPTSGSSLKGWQSWDYDISIEIELWAKGRHLKSKIDEMKDNIRQTILTNISTLEGQNLLLAEEWYDDTNVATVEVNQLKYHTGNITLYFTIK